MTAINTNSLQQPDASPVFENAIPVLVAFAPNWRARIVLLRSFGAVLVLSAFAMWLLPGVAVEAEVAPIKLGSSLLFLIFGMVLLTLRRSDNRPDAYFDPIRREVRILQKNESGRPQTVLRRSYDSLGSAHFSDRQLELFDVDGSLLMRLPLDSDEVSRALRGQLSGAVAVSA